MAVTVENGRVVWLEGTAAGPALCAKGAAAVAFEYDDERPQSPLIRTGPRGGGGWRRASWDEALDYIGDKLKAVRARCGGQGIALSDRGGPFTDLPRTFLAALGSPNYFDHDCACGRNAHNAARSVYGVGRAAIGFDFAHAKHVVLYGRNMLESLQVKEVQSFARALGRGMRCTYIDPRASLTAGRASRYWQIRPNSDYALNLALIHETLKRGLYDRDFVARWVTGMEVLTAAVRETTPEWQEAHTGIPAAELRAFLQEIAEAAPSVIFHPGWMTARHRQSFHVSQTALILNALFGSVAAQGGLLLARAPEALGVRGLKKLFDRVPKPTAPRVDGAGTQHPQWDPGSGILHRLFAALESGEPYPVGAYFAYRHDPLTAMPDGQALRAALDKLDLLVAIDVNWSETAWYADVLLPESTFLERANILGQSISSRPAFLLRDQALAPRFDSRPAWWIFREILRRLDLADALDFETVEEIWDYQLEGTGVTVAQMREQGVLSPVAEGADRAVEPCFPTPSGKIEFAGSLLAQAGLPDFPAFAPTERLTADRFYLLFGRPAVLTHGQSLNNPLLNELAGEQTLWIHPARAATLGIGEGDEVLISGAGYAAFIRAQLTPWIHPEAVFMRHGYGRTVPLQTRACGLGVADQRLMGGRLHVHDPAGGGLAMTETVVTVRKHRGATK